MAKRKDDKDRVRICLDCVWMTHSHEDFERGKCMYDCHDIGYVNSHSWCKHWKREKDFGNIDYDYSDESYDSLEI